MNEGELSGRLGLRRLAGRRRGGDHRPRLPARRARRLAAARLPRLHGRLGRDRPLGQEQGLERHRRGLPAPPAADRRAGGDVRPDLQGQPAAAHGRPTSRRCGPAWPTAPSTSSPPTTRRTRTRTRTASGRPPRSACSASRPRCRSCSRRWSTPACSTGPASPSGCPTPRRGSAGSTDHGRPIEVGAPANVVLVRPGGDPDDRPVGVGQPEPQHAVPRDGAARPRGRDVPARQGRPCSTGSSHDGREPDGAAGPRGRAHLPRRGVRRRGRDLRRGGLLHRHDRLPGDAHRPVVPPPGRRDDRPAHRQHRRQRRGPGVRRGSGSPGTSSATPPACRRTGARSAASTTSCAPRASSGSPASTPGR